MLSKLKEKQYLGLLCSILLFFIVIFPYLVVATYGSPSADDFTNLSGVLNQANSTFLGKVISQSIATYKGWQGTYTGIFLVYFGGSIYQNFGMLGLHLEYFFNVLLFFFSVWCVVRNIVKIFNFEKKNYLSISLVITSLLSFVMLYGFDVGEVFYWHTGLSVYTVPLCFSLMVVSLLLNNEMKTWEIVLASLLGFLAAGGSLDISAFVCGVSLLITFYKSLLYRKTNKSVVVFVAALVGAVLNVVAPGNYARHAYSPDKFPVVNSIKYSFSGAFKALWEYVGNGTIILLMLICILLFNRLKNLSIKFINPLLLAIILFVGSAIIDFPVYFGYAEGWLPSRCEFVRRVSMTIFVFCVLLDTTGWLATRTDKKIQFTLENGMAVILVFAISLNCCIPSGSWDYVKPFKIYNDIYYNSIDKRLTTYKETTNTILYTLKTSPGQDVVISIPSYDSLGYIKTLELTSDPNNWVNVGIAQYFGNNSIVLNVGQ